MFTIAGSEISVSSLTKEYNGLKINCVALQILDDLDTTSTAQRTVAIDVWCEFHDIRGLHERLDCIILESHRLCLMYRSAQRPLI